MNHLNELMTSVLRHLRKWTGQNTILNILLARQIRPMLQVTFL